MFNFAIIKHAKTADFLGTGWHTKILNGNIAARDSMWQRYVLKM